MLNEQQTPALDDPDIAQFKSISIPLVRRIYPQLIANKIVSVQPLLGPSGLIHYLRHRYSEHKHGHNDVPTRRKNIRKKKYRSIDDPYDPYEVVDE